MKKIWIASFIFAAATAFAQDTCTELCSSCLDNNESGPCAKVEKICKCTKMIANFKAELQGDANNKTATGSVYESSARISENRFTYGAIPKYFGKTSTTKAGCIRFWIGNSSNTSVSA